MIQIESALDFTQKFSFTFCKTETFNESLKMSDEQFYKFELAAYSFMAGFSLAVTLLVFFFADRIK
jgi:hypothetical protein